MIFIYVESQRSAVAFDSAIRNIEILNELERVGMTNNAPIAFIIVRILLQPKLPDEAVQIGFG